MLYIKVEGLKSNKGWFKELTALYTKVERLYGYKANISTLYIKADML